MMYLVLEEGQAQRLGTKIRDAAEDGWRLMGPVVPVRHGQGWDTTFMATMERSADELLTALKIEGRVPLDTRCLGED